MDETITYYRDVLIPGLEEQGEALRNMVEELSSSWSSQVEQIAFYQCENTSDFSFLKDILELQWISFCEMSLTNLKEYVTLEGHSKLSILNLESETEQANSDYLAKITPVLEERQKENAVTTEFQNDRMSFPARLERMKPIEVYDD